MSILELLLIFTLLLRLQGNEGQEGLSFLPKMNALKPLSLAAWLEPSSCQQER